jgi:hypothetical protein
MRMLKGGNRGSGQATQAPDILQPIQLVVDGKMLREVLLKVKRDQGNIALGLA